MKQLIRMAALAAATAGVALHAQPTAPIFAQYDGYVKQPNGGYVLSFGYFNQNNVDVTIDSGDANRFSPIPADRNQPVTFVKGRHRFSCVLVVDRGFDGKLQWSIAFAGKTSTTTAKMLDPLYELELNSEKRVLTGLDVTSAPRNVCVNRAPVAHAISPLGETLETLAAKAGQELPIAAQVEDDGLPRGSRLTIAWKKVSGPGTVTFSNASTASTRATFETAGEYQIELSATDGEKSTSTRITVKVS
jgi:hypothetical protein